MELIFCKIFFLFACLFTLTIVDETLSKRKGHKGRIKGRYDETSGKGTKNVHYTDCGSPGFIPGKLTGVPKCLPDICVIYPGEQTIIKLEVTPKQDFPDLKTTFTFQETGVEDGLSGTLFENESACKEYKLKCPLQKNKLQIASFEFDTPTYLPEHQQFNLTVTAQDSKNVRQFCIVVPVKVVKKSEIPEGETS